MEQGWYKTLILTTLVLPRSVAHLALSTRLTAAACSMLIRKSLVQCVRWTCTGEATRCRAGVNPVQASQTASSTLASTCSSGSASLRLGTLGFLAMPAGQGREGHGNFGYSAIHCIYNQLRILPLPPVAVPAPLIPFSCDKAVMWTQLYV